jgi:elongation factor P
VVTTNDLKNGMCLDLPEGLMQVAEFQHVKPGKGGAFVRTTLKNVRTGQTIDKTFRAGEKVEQVKIDRREWQYLYRDGTDYVFMDQESYEQMNVAPQVLGEATKYLIEQATATLMMYGDEIVGVELPPSVELDVAESEPGLQGDRSTGGTKPATLETGYVVQVPLFINTGEKVKVDTRTGDYMSRA